MTQITQIWLFSGMPVLLKSKITVWERHFFKKNFWYGSFRHLLILLQKVYSGAPVKCFFYIAKKLRFRCFRECWFWRKQISQFENDTSLKKICYGTFRYLSTLRKKVLSGALVNCFFLYDSNNSDSAVFGNGGFAEIKDHSFRTTSFQKKNFLVWKF